MSQASGSGLAGCVWLRCSQEAAIKVSAGTAVIWGLTGWEHLVPGSFMWVLAGGLSSSPQGPLCTIARDIVSPGARDLGERKPQDLSYSRLEPDFRSNTSSFLPHSVGLTRVWIPGGRNYCRQVLMEAGYHRSKWPAFLETVIGYLLDQINNNDLSYCENKFYI